jgi:transcriptional regulator with XRE-family HTH domain
MQSTNEKIGGLIAQIRQDRNLTQAEFARQMGTSQSAVNRIEHGKQNLSLETLGRISDVLNKQLISLSGGAVNLRIEGGQELKGEITLKTSKNALKRFFVLLKYWRASAYRSSGPTAIPLNSVVLRSSNLITLTLKQLVKLVAYS